MGFVFWMHKANVLDDRSSSIIAKLLWQKQYFWEGSHETENIKNSA